MKNLRWLGHVTHMGDR